MIHHPSGYTGDQTIQHFINLSRTARETFIQLVPLTGTDKREIRAASVNFDNIKFKPTRRFRKEVCAKRKLERAGPTCDI